jgi:tetratricopeptide (TPR) repeat protein
VNVGADPVYPGARPFSQAESSRFFGRGPETDQLVAEWLANPLTYLTGPAGIGKTSLLTAGAVPRVEREQRRSVHLLPVGGVSGQPSTPGPGLARFPVAALPQHNPYSLALLRSWTSAGTAPDLADVPVFRFISDYTQRFPDRIILASIDQADDLFAGPARRQRQRQGFLEELAAALHVQPRLHLLVSVRSDAYAQFAAIMGDGARIPLSPLDVSAAREAITKPGFFDPDAASMLVDSLRTSRITSGPGKERLVTTETVEPAVLQIACAGLWQSLHQHMGLATLRELAAHRDATVDAALTGYCSAMIAAVASFHQIPAEHLRTWLIETFITDVGELASTAEGQPETAGTPTTAARALEDRYLLRARDEGGRLYQLICDRVIEPLRGTDELEADPGHVVPVDPDDCLRAAERARISGEHDLAAKLAGHVLHIASQEDLRRLAAAHTLIGDLAYEQGYFEDAEQSYRDAMLLFGTCSDTIAVGHLLLAIACTYIDRGNLNEALIYLRSAASRVSDQAVRKVILWVLQTMAQAPPGPAQA